MRYEWILIGIIVTIGMLSAMYLYSRDTLSLIYYNDSISHLVRSRELVDSLSPGLKQLGTAWLPVPHIMLLPFSLVDILFRTGFAGLMVSLPSLAISSVFLYRIIRVQTGITYISLAGALLYALNPNTLYLGLISMTEIPFMLFLILSAYYFQKYISRPPSLQNTDLDLRSTLSRTGYSSNQLAELIKCAIFISLATLCRYEGWIIPIFLVIYIIITVLRGGDNIITSTTMRGEISLNRYTVSKIYPILVSLLSFIGIALWMTYNAYYYGDPLEFQSAEFWSAAWHTKEFGSANTLYLNPLNVSSQYIVTALFFYGPILLIGALIGFVSDFFFKNNKLKKLTRSTPLYIYLLLPALVVPISLLIGNGELNTRHQWFNARFLILLSPIAILLFSVFLLNLYQRFNRRRFIIYGLICSVFLSQLLMSSITVVTFADGLHNKSNESRPFVTKTAEVLKSIYTTGEVMIITGSAQKNYIMQAAGIPLKNFVKVYDADIGKESFKKPWIQADYIIISKKPDASAKSASKYWLDRQDKLDEYYHIAYENKYYKIMIKKQP